MNILGSDANKLLTFYCTDMIIICVDRYLTDISIHIYLYSTSFICT